MAFYSAKFSTFIMTCDATIAPNFRIKTINFKGIVAEPKSAHHYLQSNVNYV
ncbi:hypothetical protein Z949_2697 [Sulfitobacter guttiformis KCTC 32187]|nr:hypothetical protein Z949_2697 [Sulfitobacter guttiformis KCTC 32187]